VHGQAGLDPCWSQTHYVGFVMAQLICINYNQMFFFNQSLIFINMFRQIWGQYTWNNSKHITLKVIGQVSDDVNIFQPIQYSPDISKYYLYSLGIPWAAVFLTYGDMSITASLIDNIIIGAIICTLILDNTRRALALINWFGSCVEIYIFIYNVNYTLSYKGLISDTKSLYTCNHNCLYPSILY
jgi:hypothetical protein